MSDICSFAWAVAKAHVIAAESGRRQRVRRCTCQVIERPHYTIRPANLPSVL